MDKEVRLDPFSITFNVQEDKKTVRIPKSQTKVQFTEQFNLLTHESDMFVPLGIKEDSDAYLFTFTIEDKLITWDQLKKKEPNEQLRALFNVSTLLDLMSTRITFFLHPDNLVFDRNLMPRIIYRGIYGLSWPYETDEAEILKQYKSIIIEMFSDEYSFEDIYKGSVDKAANTPFTKLINEQTSLRDLQQVLENEYDQTQAKTEKEQMIVPIKRFTMYKHLSIWVSVVAVILLSLLIYTSLIRAPYQDKLLQASHAFLATDYDEVIQILQEENPEKLPQTTKYLLASAYLTLEPLSDEEKDSIRKNISINSDKRYLLYWIYNGSGDFDRSIDIAKYVDDPTLIMYGLIKRVEQVKNDPGLSGEERDDEVRKLREELEKHVDEYELDIDTEEVETEYTDYQTEEEEAGNPAKSIKDTEQEKEEDKEKGKDKGKEKDKDDKKKK